MPNFVGRHIGTQGATSIFVSSSKSQKIACYKFWEKFKFESSMNFKGIQTFLKKSNNFYKIPYPHPILDYKFTLTHLYFIPNRVGHLRLLPPVSQV
jgi:hypothetical protein